MLIVDCRRECTRETFMRYQQNAKDIDALAVQVKSTKVRKLQKLHQKPLTRSSNLNVTAMICINLHYQLIYACPLHL